MWSLTQDLCDLANEVELPKALCRLGLISSDVYQLYESNEWIRGGAETYIYKFWVKDGEKREQCFLAKACVTFPSGHSLQETLDEWVAKRRLLTDNHISTPNLVIYGKGIIVEEFIEYALVDRLKMLKTDHELHPLLIELSKYTATICKIGFNFIDIFSDLRSRGEDVVMVDFGEDLGHISQITHNPLTVYSLLEKQLNDWEIRISASNKVAIDQVFQDSLKRHKI